MKKYSHETKNRIISITLAFLLILATIYTVPLKGGVNAAAGPGTATLTGTTWYLSSETGGTCEFSLRVEEGEQRLYFDDPNGNEYVVIQPGYTLYVEYDSSLVIEAGNTTNVNITVVDDSDATINGNNTGDISFVEIASIPELTIAGTNTGSILSGDGVLYISSGGTLNVPGTFTNSCEVRNSGTIAATNIDINSVTVDVGMIGIAIHSIVLLKQQVQMQLLGPQVLILHLAITVLQSLYQAM